MASSPVLGSAEDADLRDIFPIGGLPAAPPPSGLRLLELPPLSPSSSRLPPPPGDDDEDEGVSLTRIQSDILRIRPFLTLALLGELPPPSPPELMMVPVELLGDGGGRMVRSDGLGVLSGDDSPETQRSTSPCRGSMGMMQGMMTQETSSSAAHEP